jgi:zinc D-Ala-D-Ala carboxypeptidase
VSQKNRWPYFNPETDKKMTCSCGCGRMELQDDFMKKIVLARIECGFSFHIISGFRCPKYNNQVSKTGFNGPHTTGRALDIAADSRQKSQIMRALRSLGFTRFGIAKTFIHVDNLTQKENFAEDVIWTY